MIFSKKFIINNSKNHKQPKKNVELKFLFNVAEVEMKYEEALTREEERITYQRKLLLLYQKKIRERENEMLIEAQNSLQRKSTMARENELEMLLRNLEKQVSEL